MQKKGFTLIELIVIISVLAILVTLSVVVYKGYTKEAKKAEYTNNIKVLENASERYYIKEGAWPRLTDEYFTASELETYSEKIMDITGEAPELDPEGKYYEIDYVSLAKYIQTPKEKGNYIIQNPVGRVMYLENITETGEDKLTNYIPPYKTKDPEESDDIEQPEDNEQHVIFSGLSPEAFDGDPTTSSSTGTVTWRGDLISKKVKINLGSGTNASTTRTISFYIYDEIGTPLKFINLTDSTEVNVLKTEGTIIKEIIVPEGAAKFVIVGTYGRVNSIEVTEHTYHPKEITNIQSETTDSSITLTWENNSENYEKTIIYRDGKFISVVQGKTYTDKPLYAGVEYNYELRAVNTYGNASKNLVTHTARTKNMEIKFQGLSPEAFDGDSTTYSNVGTATWEGDLSNKKIRIAIKSGTNASTTRTISFFIYDELGNQLKFINLTDSTEVNVLSTQGAITKDIIVPDGAVKIVTSGTNGKVMGITVAENLYQPNKITNIQSTSTDSNITLTWENSSENYDKAVIYRDGKFINIVQGKTYTDKPLYAGTEHTYTIRAINTYGNASGNTETHVESTTNSKGIKFQGLSPDAFDGDSTTSSDIGTATWEGDLNNKKVRVTLKSGSNASTTRTISFYIHDELGKQLNFTNLTDGKEVNVLSTQGTITKDIIVPEGAVKIVASGTYGYGKVIDITVIN